MAININMVTIMHIRVTNTTGIIISTIKSIATNIRKSVGTNQKNTTIMSTISTKATIITM